MLRRRPSNPPLIANAGFESTLRPRLTLIIHNLTKEFLRSSVRSQTSRHFLCYFAVIRGNAFTSGPRSPQMGSNCAVWQHNYEKHKCGSTMWQHECGSTMWQHNYEKHQCGSTMWQHDYEKQNCGTSGWSRDFTTITTFFRLTETPQFDPAQRLSERIFTRFQFNWRPWSPHFEGNITRPKLAAL